MMLSSTISYHDKYYFHKTWIILKKSQSMVLWIHHRFILKEKIINYALTNIIITKYHVLTLNHVLEELIKNKKL